MLENSKFVAQKYAIDFYRSAKSYESEALKICIDIDEKQPIDIIEIAELLSKADNLETRNNELLDKISFALKDQNLEQTDIDDLKVAKTKVAATISFNEGSLKFEKSLNESRKRDQPLIRGYYLQNCEAILKEISFLLPELEKKFEDILIAKSTILREEYKTYEQSRLNELAKKNMDEFNSENKKNIDIFKADSKNHNNLTEVIEIGMNLLKTLTEKSIENFGNSIPDVINNYLSELQNTIQNLVETRQKKYEEWALAQIQSGFIEGLDGIEKIPLIPHKKELFSKSLINNFGEIDNTILSYHLSKTYSECFEYLLGKLEVPSKDTFTKTESKLYVLKQISEMEKRKIESF